MSQYSSVEGYTDVCALRKQNKKPAVARIADRIAS